LVESFELCKSQFHVFKGKVYHWDIYLTLCFKFLIFEIDIDTNLRLFERLRARIGDLLWVGIY